MNLDLVLKAIFATLLWIFATGMAGAAVLTAFFCRECLKEYRRLRDKFDLEFAAVAFMISLVLLAVSTAMGYTAVIIMR